MRCSLVVILLLFSLISAIAAAPLDNYGNTTISPGPAEPLPYTIKLFILSSDMIHSDHILDQINTPEGGVLFGTSFGLSQYNGTWSSRHVTHGNISQGLMDEFIKAVEYDHDGNLWIGYSGGIQVYNGVYYQTIRDQQLLKDLQINDLQRWDNDMWVATGHAGIHRFRDGTWTWFQPMTKNGPGFYEVSQMTLDTAGEVLIIATADNGLWMISSPDDPVQFSQVAPKEGSFGTFQQVRRDPNGGVLFFNDTSVVHYTPATGFIPVLTRPDLTIADIEINDLTAAPDGKLYIATDRGIYIWKDGIVLNHLTRFEGIGTSEIVDTITIDAKNRVWFASEENVGYYSETSAPEKPLPIEIVTPAEGVITEKPTATLPAIITAQPTDVPADSGSGTGGLSPILDPIIRAINAILSKFGAGPATPL